jgi:hypothetical protein
MPPLLLRKPVGAGCCEKVEEADGKKIVGAHDVRMAARAKQCYHDSRFKSKVGERRSPLRAIYNKELINEIIGEG